MAGDGGAVCCAVFAFPIIELIFFLFNYYEIYSVVFPGSTVANNLNGGGGMAFTVFKWMICWCSGTLTVPASIYLTGVGIKGVAEGLGDGVGACIACVFAPGLAKRAEIPKRGPKPGLTSCGWARLVKLVQFGKIM